MPGTWKENLPTVRLFSPGESHPEIANGRTVFILVTYDIPSDKLRTKVADALESYGKRVQYSVFECNLTSPQYAALKKRLADITDAGDDEGVWSIRFYRLCAACVKRIEILGHGQVTQDDAFYIV